MKTEEIALVISGLAFIMAFSTFFWNRWKWKNEQKDSIRIRLRTLISNIMKLQMDCEDLKSVAEKIDISLMRIDLHSIKLPKKEENEVLSIVDLIE